MRSAALSLALMAVASRSAFASAHSGDSVASGTASAEGLERRLSLSVGEAAAKAAGGLASTGANHGVGDLLDKIESLFRRQR
jgi:hypothetical protein